jgi:hypothetical protein
VRLRDTVLKVVPSVVAVLVASACGLAAAPAESQAAGLTCMPTPSACGFPDTTNTGVTPGAPLTPEAGDVTLDAPGQIYENRVLSGSITVKAQNVTIRNVRLIVNDPYYGIRVTPGGSWDGSNANLTLDHVEINLNGHPDIKGIAFSGFTARNVFFHNGADCAHFHTNVVIQDSMCVLGPDVDNDGNPDAGSFCSGDDHFDGFQSDGGYNITLRHNTIRNPCGQTSAILMSTNTAPISNVVIDGNLMAGGGYTVYCGTDSGGIAAHETYTNNVISPVYFPKGGKYGPDVLCNKAEVTGGNIWDGNYVPPSSSGGGAGSGTTPASEPSKVVYPLSGARASRITRSALKREFGRRYTRRVKGMSMKCRRRSRSTIACSVKWRSIRERSGVYRRYKGTVTVTRIAANGWRYSLRIRSWSSRCDCSKLIKRSRSF